MKNIVLLISFFALLLLGAEARTEVLPVTEDVVSVSVSEGEVMDRGFILPMQDKHLWDGMVFTEAEPLTGQLTASRSYRFVTSQGFLLSKALIRRIAVLRMALSNRSAVLACSLLPCQSWEVSSEHYVFGMRRILI